MLQRKSLQCIGFCPSNKSYNFELCRKLNPFPGSGRRNPFGIWYNRLAGKGIFTCPLEAWHGQLRGWRPGLARDNPGRVESWHICGWEDPTLLLAASVVLDDELVNKDYNDDDNHNENCAN